MTHFVKKPDRNDIFFFNTKFIVCVMLKVYLEV